jgi:hypothetical protein
MGAETVSRGARGGPGEHVLPGSRARLEREAPHTRWRPEIGIGFDVGTGVRISFGYGCGARGSAGTSFALVPRPRDRASLVRRCPPAPVWAHGFGTVQPPRAGPVIRPGG